MHFALLFGTLLVPLLLQTIAGTDSSEQNAEEPTVLPNVWLQPWDVSLFETNPTLAHKKVEKKNASSLLRAAAPQEEGAKRPKEGAAGKVEKDRSVEAKSKEEKVDQIALFLEDWGSHQKVAKIAREKVTPALVGKYAPVADVIVFDLQLNGLFCHIEYMLHAIRWSEDLKLRPYFFFHHGHYYDEKRGVNWVDYFFDQPTISKYEAELLYSSLLDKYAEKQNEKIKEMIDEAAANSTALQYLPGRILGGIHIILPDGEPMDVSEWVRAHGLLPHVKKNRSIQQEHDLFFKYLPIKSNITALVDRFVSQHFAGYHVVGVHYRGTDKESEAPRTPYPMVAERLRMYLKYHPSARIFVASDEHGILKYLEEEFPGNLVLYLKSAPRSLLQGAGPPIWAAQFPGNRRAKGEYALLDCIILSRTNFLIRTSSLLSAYSQVINPSLPTHLIQKQKFDWAPENLLPTVPLSEFEKY